MTGPATDPRSLTAEALRLARAGRRPAAIGILDRALAEAPDLVQSRYLRGLLRLDAGDDRGAAADLAHAVTLDPSAPPINAALGSARMRAGDLGGADRALRRALLLEPAQPDALASHAGCRIGLLDFAAALRSAERALLLAPAHAQAAGNRAEALHHLGRVQEAAAWLEAVAGSGAGPQLRLNLALTLLSLERWRDGWAQYEARLDPAIPDHIRRSHRLPRWQPGLDDRPVAVLAEQGVGEQLLFLRYVPALRQRAAAVAVEVDAKLLPLVARSLPGVVLFPARRFRDVHGPVADEREVRARGAGSAIEIASLPAALGGLPPQGAAAAPYLLAEAAQVASFRAALGAEGQRLVGVCWRSRNAAFGGFKSTRLADWAPILAIPGVTFVNLQYGEVGPEVDEAVARGGARVRAADVDLFGDIDGAAALVAAMDLVITTGSTTAQLAGALGVPAWVLLSRGPGLMWYWGHGDRTPWYPAMRLFRQQVPGDWRAPVDAAAAALAEWAGSGAFSRRPPRVPAG